MLTSKISIDQASNRTQFRESQDGDDHFGGVGHKDGDEIILRYPLILEESSKSMDI
jgi:hypothetical protein